MTDSRRQDAHAGRRLELHDERRPVAARSFKRIFTAAWVDAIVAVAQEALTQAGGAMPPQLPRLLAGANSIAAGTAGGLSEYWTRSPIGAMGVVVFATVAGSLVERGAEWVGAERP